MSKLVLWEQRNNLICSDQVERVQKNFSLFFCKKIRVQAFIKKKTVVQTHGTQFLDVVETTQTCWEVGEVPFNEIINKLLSY